MASFLYTKNADGSYYGRGRVFGTIVELVCESFEALWSFFCGKKGE